MKKLFSDVLFGARLGAAFCLVVACLIGLLVIGLCGYGLKNPGTLEVGRAGRDVLWIALRDPTPVVIDAVPLVATQPTQYVIRGTVLRQDGSAIGDVSVWLLRDTGNGFVVIGSKPVDPSGGFGFYVSPVQANYRVKVDLPYGYAMIGPNPVDFSWSTIGAGKFIEFRAMQVTPTPTPTPTLSPTPPVPTATNSPAPSATLTPTPTPSEGVLELSAMVRVIIAEEVYGCYAVHAPLDPYSSITEMMFWQISQVNYQLGVPLTPIVQVFVQDVEYCAVGFICEILVMRADDISRFAVIDYNGVQLNH